MGERSVWSIIPAILPWENGDGALFVGQIGLRPHFPPKFPHDPGSPEKTFPAVPIVTLPMSMIFHNFAAHIDLIHNSTNGKPYGGRLFS